MSTNDMTPVSRWQDPLGLIQREAPSRPGRIVLWVVSLLVGAILVWAFVGRLDIVTSAPGRLVPHTLLKIVQPTEAGIVRELRVREGEVVRAGQVLARLDPTLAEADHTALMNDLRNQRLQLRRIDAALADQTMALKSGDDPARFAEVSRQHDARRKVFADSLEQQQALLAKAEHEKKTALDVLAKLEQVLPSYQRSAQAYEKLEKQGFVGPLASAEKQREATEKARDYDAQKGVVASLEAAIEAQRKRISQLKSGYESDLQNERIEVLERISRLEPALDKTRFKTRATELRAPQDGIIKELATTTVGAVVQPGTVLMTLVPQHEALYADVDIRNEDVGFVHEGQPVKIKLATYPFQRYGLLSGRIIHLGPDADAPSTRDPDRIATYKARVQLDQQTLTDPQGNRLPLSAGMQVQADIHQGERSVMEYLLSPVKKAVSEAARER